jgi:spore coat polysaccharide biosynthesis protein SpsF (cytidylyltransferase family)
MPSRTHAIAVIDLGDFLCPEVQPSASRFAERKLGGQPLVVRMARRLSECARVDQIFVTGSNIPSSFLISGLAGIELMNFPSVHVCQRLAAAADQAEAEWVVYVPANRPFVDPTLIDQLLARVAQTNECDYIAYGSPDGNWRRMDDLGLAGEVCHADTLRRLRRNADRLPEPSCGSFASWLEHAPGAYHLKYVPVPAELDRCDLRFAVSNETDWDDAELLCETVTGEDSPWQELTQLVKGNELMRESMATRNG